MTIAHGLWCPRHLYLDRPAETFAFVCHVLLIRACLSVLVYQSYCNSVSRSVTTFQMSPTASPWRAKWYAARVRLLEGVRLRR
jgi:hypothetical protein